MTNHQPWPETHDDGRHDYPKNRAAEILATPAQSHAVWFDRRTMTTDRRAHSRPDCPWTLDDPGRRREDMLWRAIDNLKIRVDMLRERVARAS